MRQNHISNIEMSMDNWGMKVTLPKSLYCDITITILNWLRWTIWLNVNEMALARTRTHMKSNINSLENDLRLAEWLYSWTFYMYLCSNIFFFFRRIFSARTSLTQPHTHTHTPQKHTYIINTCIHFLPSKNLETTERRKKMFPYKNLTKWIYYIT